MLKKTLHTAPLDKISQVTHQFDEAKKYDLTEPTGDFFYDPWKLKKEFEGTDWEDIWRSLPIDSGQARVIVLESGTCYFQHADIDDRFHLNLRGDEAYLIDLENEIMHKCNLDGIWYEMDAGRLHSAASFGKHNRAQLVVRKLLTKNKLTNPIEILVSGSGETLRYDFDNTLSIWLNKANKSKIITDFTFVSPSSVQFKIEEQYINYLKLVLPNNFKITT